MKFTTSTIFTLLAASAQAWELTVAMTDGRTVKSHGTLDSGCETYDFAMTKPVNKAVFKESTFAKTFELYEQVGCRGKVSYRENGGTHSMTPRVIKSYKVF